MKRSALLFALLVLPAQLRGESVTFSVTDARMDTIRDGLTANVHLQSDPASDLIYKVIVHVPEPLVRGRTLDGLSKGVITPESFVDYGDGTKSVPVTILPPMTASRWSLSTLFHHSVPVTVPISVSYAVRDEPERTTDTYDVTVTPRGPITGAIVGGILGVLVALLFQLSFALATDGRKSVTRPYLRQATGRFFLGVLVAVLIILVFRLDPTKLDKLPVAVDVKDAFGGFLVGLFFQPLANALAKRLGLGDAPAPPAAAAGTT